MSKYLDQLKRSTRRSLSVEARIGLMRIETFHRFRRGELSDEVFLHQVKRICRLQESTIPFDRGELAATEVR